MLQTKLYKQRSAYKGQLIPSNRDPLKLFSRWFAQAQKKHKGENHAMVLSTCSKDGRPSSRFVLLKDFSREGFVFYTNLTSRKAQQLQESPYASLLFYWPELHRQIRIEGKVKRVGGKEADIYFASRPRGSQIAAWASNQSSLLKDRKELEGAFATLKAKFQGKKIPRPPFWGGYRIVPSRFEFWSGMPNRMHDRLQFRRSRKNRNSWILERLFP